VNFVTFLTIGWLGDCSVMYQLGFQDPATATMEGIFLFNLHLLFVIIGIVLLVAWLLFIILRNFTELTIAFYKVALVKCFVSSIPTNLLKQNEQ
jgi:heme/copper-type cytochrome/quinol oxidase subunit 2